MIINPQLQAGLDFPHIWLLRLLNLFNFLKIASLLICIWDAVVSSKPRLIGEEAECQGREHPRRPTSQPCFRPFVCSLSHGLGPDAAGGP